PAVGESITEVQIVPWLKAEGETVAKDENVVTIESEKATVDLPAPAAGTLTKILKQKGSTAKVGEVIAQIDPTSKGSAAKARTEPPDKTAQPAAASHRGTPKAAEERPE